MPGSDPPWLQAAVVHLEQLLRDEPELAPLLGATLARLGGSASAASLRVAFCRVLSTPFLRLLAALAADLGVPESDERVVALGEATAWLYLYVRLQDDLVDEPEQTPIASVFVMERLLCLHLDAFVRGAPTGLGRRNRQMARFARAMAAEEGARTGGRLPDGLGWLGDKFLPAAVALSALAAACRDEQAGDAVAEVVCELGVAWQLANDAHDVARDAAAGRPTPLGERCAAAGEPPTGIGLLAGGTLSAAVTEARRHVAAARARALAAGLPRLARAADEADDRLDRLPGRLMAEALGLPAA